MPVPSIAGCATVSESRIEPTIVFFGTVHVVFRPVRSKQFDPSHVFITSALLGRGVQELKVHFPRPYRHSYAHIHTHTHAPVQCAARRPTGMRAHSTARFYVWCTPAQHESVSGGQGEARGHPRPCAQQGQQVSPW